MLLDSQHAAGFERAIQRRKRLRGLPTRQPIVDVAERQDHIDGVGRQRIGAVRREAHHCDAVIEIGPGGELVPVSLQAVGDAAACGVGRDDPCIVLALGAHQRSDHFGVPARFRPDFQDAHLGADTEEQQGFLRVPVAIARPVGFRALGALENPVQRLDRRLSVAGRRAAGGQDNGRQSRGGPASSRTERPWRYAR